MEINTEIGSLEQRVLQLLIYCCCRIQEHPRPVQPCRKSGPEHVATLAARNILAMILMGRGRLDEAEDLLLKNLEIAKRSRVEGKIALASFNLCGLMNQQERMAEAESMCIKSLEMHRRLLGDDNPTTLGAMKHSPKVVLRLLLTRIQEKG